MLSEDHATRSMQRGDRLLVAAVGAMTVLVQHNEQERQYFIGAFTRGHEAHRGLGPGDTLLVVSESAPNGETAVEMPGCGCRAYLAPR
jgi:hypothetical protein